MTDVKNKQVAIMGWAVDTQDVAPWLIEQGAKITVLDEKEELENKVAGVEWRLGREAFSNLGDFDVIVRTPGVYRYRPELAAAEKAGVVITSKTKLFFEVCPTRNIIGVTGTKGKGTTSTLIYQMLKEGGKDVYVAGNIGEGMFSFLPNLTAESWIVLELSSFQLIDLEQSPHIGVCLMVTSEHLDWHKDVEEYVAAKSAIAKYQNAEDFSIFNDQYPNSVKIGMQGYGQKVPVNKSMWQGETRLRGEHNKENLVAAAAAARAAGVDDEIVVKVAAEFKGLEHRLEEVAEIEGVTYYNDSFSTTPETAIAAIRAFTEPEILILGGSDKGSDYSQLGKTIAESHSVKAVVLIGQMAPNIKRAIKEAGSTVHMLEGAENMNQILQQVRSVARPGDVVLLSPACASFGMFKNYKDRGKQFKDLLMSL